MELLSDDDVELGRCPVDCILPRRSPLVGFLRHSPPQAMYGHFDQLCQWRSHHETCCGDCDAGAPRSKQQTLKLPRGSPYVGSHRHAPPSPVLSFSAPRRKGLLSPTLPPTLELPSAALEVRGPSSEVPGQLPEEAWLLVLSLVAEVNRISCLSRVARGFSVLLKSELVWAHRAVQVPPAVIVKLAPVLGTWLPAWRLASKLIIPRSLQLITELSQQMPDLPIEVAWRFDSELKGEGVEVINHGRSVRRVAGAEEELVVLGDAPLPQTVATAAIALSQAPYLEVTLDDRSADVDGDNLNDFGIGVTARPPSNINELGAVADEVPLSWVVDFTKSSVILSVNNSQAAKGWKVSAEDLEEGDRVGLRVTPAGCFEIFINGELREHLAPSLSECIPQGVELFPVLDLYGCTAQLSRTDADRPY